MDEQIAEASDLLRDDHGLAVKVEDRTIVLEEPVKGDLGHAVLRVLGVAQDASPVGAAAQGPTGVAAGTWRNPELYLVRWTKGRRWVVGYRLNGGSKPNDYVRTEGRIPTRLETGNWYGDVPDPVAEAFLEAGLLLDDPPFPLPPPPRPAPAEPPAARRPAAKRPRPAPEPRSDPAAPGPRPRPRTEGVRLCPSCRMHKGLAQFVAGSDLCVDCR
ncbi:MAG: hypothetical protein KY454_07605 [Actinobacteria bacterium]|nr:hypothetical protein [Actinomycetota bacterium]MBW3651169.1 hypothetical protein [Actinomycetota bacterium]